MKKKIIIIINLVLIIVLIGKLYEMYTDNTVLEFETKETYSETEYTEKVEEKEDVIEINYSVKLLTVIDNSAEEWIEDIKAFGEGQYEDLYKNADGSVTIKVTEEQRIYWLNFYKGMITKLQDDFSNIDEEYKIICNEDYTQVDYYFNLNLSTSTAAYYILSVEAFCACVQIFDEVSIDEWYVDANIYNANTEKLVTSGNSEVGLSYTAEDWRNSQ